MEILKKLWKYISNIGIDEQVSYVEQIKIRVLNQAAFIGILMQIVITIQYLFLLKVEGIVIGVGFTSFLFCLLFLNKRQYFKIAQTLLNIIFPLLIVIIGILYGGQTGIQYNLMIFIVTAFFFHQKLFVKLLLGSYNVILYLILNYYWTHYSSPYSYIINTLIEPMSFIVAAIIVVTILYTFMREIEKADVQNKGLLHSLAENNEELKTANQELERFAYIASHDLKTPLRTILGFTELLERDFNNDKLKNFPTYFTHVKHGAKQMNELIKNTLEYSRINHIGEEKTWVDLDLMIQNIRNAYISNTNIQIIATDLQSIFAEENQILSLFQNLIENGLKYNDKPQKVIHISTSETPYSIQIIIKDNGIGISKKFHEQIFMMFKRLHTNQQYEGTGLGLAICEKIVDRMNGEISLSSVEGDGTTFYIDLPKKI